MCHISWFYVRAHSFQGTWCWKMLDVGSPEVTSLSNCNFNWNAPSIQLSSSHFVYVGREDSLKIRQVGRDGDDRPLCEGAPCQPWLDPMADLMHSGYSYLMNCQRRSPQTGRSLLPNTRLSSSVRTFLRSIAIHPLRSSTKDKGPVHVSQDLRRSPSLGLACLLQYYNYYTLRCARWRLVTALQSILCLVFTFIPFL